MLELKGIKKIYEMGKSKDKNYQTVEALKGVSVQFRDTEFVAVLGQSGCGKTTLLNIIGGLDQYSEGDLIINGVSTKKYSDKDWDNYRNHKIGFIFQSYNLIPHQTVLENVELALTLSGVSKEERKLKAQQALIKVGLADKINNKPSQLSGGQMQRVAIARAIVNDPDIILADEPTGALDTATSIQVMDILKDISQDKLIIMVTHNPELAEKYSTRIIKLLDGRIIDDSAPFNFTDDPNYTFVKNESTKEEKTSMSFTTALSLSGKNLWTKKTRTALVAAAGSIGIIGISLVLSLSNGFNMYINQIQQDTLSTYPLTISTTSIDYSSVVESFLNNGNDSYVVDEDGKVHANKVMIDMFETVINGSSTNNLQNFKKYIADNNEVFEDYTIKYGYNLNLNVYDSDGTLLNPMTVFTDLMAEIARAYNEANPSNTTDFTPLINQINNLNTSVYTEMLDNENIIKGQYELVGESYGSRWPANYDECLMVINEDYTVNDYVLYALGLSEDPTLKDIADGFIKDYINGTGEYEINISPISYEQILNKKYRILLQTDYYQEQENGTYSYKKDDEEFISSQLQNENVGIDLKIVGIVREKKNVTAHSISSPIGYLPSLTKEMIKKINASPIMVEQKAHPDIDVLTGQPFKQDNKTTAEKRDYIITYLNDMDYETLKMILSSSSEGQTLIERCPDEESLKSMLSSYIRMLPDDSIETLYSQFTSQNTYAGNLSNFGNVSEDSPSTISFYCSTFEKKNELKSKIDDYNKTMKNDPNYGENYVISYTDMVAIMMTSVSTIIDSISYVLIAFISVSLIVSSIMIGIITYISVIERTKEIGVLRSIGASKKDVKHVFTAETLIIGFISGVFGILVTVILDLPISLIIYNLSGIPNVARLPILGGVILVLLSCLLTFIAGLIPSKYASKQDPVISLRSE